MTTNVQRSDDKERPKDNYFVLAAVTWCNSLLWFVLLFSFLIDHPKLYLPLLALGAVAHFFLHWKFKLERKGLEDDLSTKILGVLWLLSFLLNFVYFLYVAALVSSDV